MEPGLRTRCLKVQSTFWANPMRSKRNREPWAILIKRPRLPACGRLDRDGLVRPFEQTYLVLYNERELMVQGVPNSGVNAEVAVA
jgi:hypothetical protein